MTSAEREAEARAEGRVAFGSGKTIAANPYQLRLSTHSAWEVGYKEARDEADERVETRERKRK